MGEVLDAIKEACGEDFPIVLRMSGSERDPQGNTLEDMNMSRSSRTGGAGSA